MAKLEKTNETQSRKARYEADTQPTFFQKFKDKYWKKDEPEELTFATKHQKARKLNKKKIGIYIALGITIASVLAGLATPVIQSIQAPKPREEVKSDVTADQAVKQEKDKVTKASQDKVEASKKAEEAKKEEADKVVEQKVKEELEKETAKVVEEYNKKLEEATKSVQSANTEAAKAKADKEALQKQVDELKQQLAQAQNQSRSNTPTQPAQTQPSQTAPSSSADRVTIPQ